MFVDDGRLPMMERQVLKQCGQIVQCVLYAVCLGPEVFFAIMTLWTSGCVV